MIRSLFRLFTQAAPKTVTAAPSSVSTPTPPPSEPAVEKKKIYGNPLDPRYNRSKSRKISYFTSDIKVNNKLLNTLFYKENKQYFTKFARKIWLIHQFLLKSPVTTKELWARYQEDQKAQKKGLFRSEFNRFVAYET